MRDAIPVFPFPPLVWSGRNWEGEVELPSWAGFLGGGPYWLAVDAKDEAPPTPEQAAALRHFLDSEASVTAAVTRALLEYYPRARARCIDAYDGDSACIAEVEEILPEVVTDAAGLRPLVGLSGVHILSVALEGIAYVGFALGCEWDEEHGAGVMTHRGRVVAVGQMDVASARWAPREDAARAEPGATPDPPH